MLIFAANNPQNCLNSRGGQSNCDTPYASSEISERRSAQKNVVRRREIRICYFTLTAAIETQLKKSLLIIHILGQEESILKKMKSIGL